MIGIKMGKEKFVSSTLSRKRFQEILLLFHQSTEKLGDDRNKIKIVTYDGEKLVVKSFKTPNLINKIVYRFFRKSKAARSYYNAEYLKEKGVGTPAAIAFLESLSIIGLDKSYYVSAYAAHDFTFRALIGDETLENKEEILIQFTSFMYKMHEAGVYFLDNSPGNTLISKKGNKYEFSLVDLNRMKFYDIPYGERLKNFERLAPHKWMYDIMGKEYASLSSRDEKETIDVMWRHTHRFQEAFYRKKRFKKRLKKILGK
jgi:hypothetical protein